MGRSLDTDVRTAIPTGFEILDRALGGGVKTRDLTLVGGLPGVGKTVTTLQWARNAAVSGRTVVFACYEHDERTLFIRLLLSEIGLAAEQGMPLEAERTAVRQLRAVNAGDVQLSNALRESEVLADAARRVYAYAPSLWLVRASGAATSLKELQAMVVENGAQVLVVDYLQKVPSLNDAESELERITRVSQGLKELAMESNVAVVAVAAADRHGLEAPRLRLRHLRGSSAMAYEADVALILNEKINIVSKAHVAHDLTSVERFKGTVVFTLEKNREGMAMADMEFIKDFEHYRIKPAGRLVAERLVDDRIVTD